MKKLDIICIIIGVICFLLAGYIVYIKFFKENKIDFNEEEEIKLLDDKLAKIGTPLGWLIITDGIDHQNEDGTKYNISYGTNLLKEYSNRQLFTMKYILSTKNENDKFILLSGFDNNKIEGEPTDDYTLAYLDYDTFNKYYKDLSDVTRFNAWKNDMYRNWKDIKITQKEDNLNNIAIDAGKCITVRCQVELPNINPEPISVECYYGKILENGVVEDISIIPMQQIKTKAENSKNYEYETKIELKTGGNYGYTFRVMPKHEMLLESANMDLVKWITQD